MKGTILVNRYELLEKIGEGGMALVYKARCKILDRIVAVKILKEEYSNDSNFVDKFRTEAHSVAKLSHPNIVNIFDVGQEGNIYFIVMEYVEGDTLSDLIARKAPLENELAIDIAIMICDGIHHAHEQGIIHKDIKPHNILITSTGIVKVADFGIAYATSKETITFGENVLGTVQYISPEQAKGEPVTRTTDIYSVGCVLYEMLTAKIPFDAESPITIALKHIHDEAQLPQEINNNIPTSLQNIVLKAMSKIPNQRFETAQEMRNRLLSLHIGEGNKHLYRTNNENTLIMTPLSDESEADKLKKRRIKTGRMTILVVAIIGLLSGVLFVMGNNLFGNEVIVPDIVGMDIKEAKDELEKEGLKMTLVNKEFSNDYEVDQVISQDPKEGMKVKEGREIKVILSKGAELKKVPYVVGYKIADAKLMIKNEGFEVGEVQKAHDSKYPIDVVISQNPASGSKSGKNTSIDLMISLGEAPDRAPMPNLIGLTLDEARNKLKEHKLLIGEIKKLESNEYYKDIVIDQDTEAGVLIDEESSIIITVSKGPGPVAQTKTIEFKLPEDQDYYKVVIRVNDGKGKKEVYNELLKAGEQVYIGISYYGQGTAEVLLNGKTYKTFDL
ncbi:MAG TPA: protein kinase [Syntrophomonadaceae bacterium]|nr:protein kinase [Syntrophomonadaceae bacterium]